MDNLSHARDRGLASFLLFIMIGGLILFGLGWAALDPFAEDLFARGINSPSATVGQGATWHRTIWRFGPFLVCLFLSAAIMQRAVFESRGGI